LHADDGDGTQHKPGNFGGVAVLRPRRSRSS
jgi:hypothetical protein